MKTMMRTFGVVGMYLAINALFPIWNATQVWAQSTDRDHPTPLTSSELRITGKPRKS